jgi:hypothetical protein
MFLKMEDAVTVDFMQYLNKNGLWGIAQETS